MGGVDGGGRGGLHGEKQHQQTTNNNNNKQTNKNSNKTQTTAGVSSAGPWHKGVKSVLCSLVGGLPAPSRRSVLPPLRRCPAMSQ